MLKNNLPFKSNFLKIYNSIIYQSKNIFIPQQLVQYIVLNFQKKILIINSNKLRKFNINNINQIQVFCINPEQLDNINNNFILKNKKQIQYQLKINDGLAKIQNDVGYICLYYDLLKNKKDKIQNVLKHQLTHIFENNNIEIWKDLFPIQIKNINQISDKENIVFMTLNINYDMTYRDIYYLTSANQFQSYCTSLQNNKQKLDKNILNNINQFVLNGQLNDFNSDIKTLYMFIFLNFVFDKSRQRIQYIKQHLK